ncbi:FCD domain-containing protein [Pseudoroseomonas cervicalis]|uniref:GntR family transcriptional regulator n=1 Tax=Teichococcus cervicalis TaxID=204525 RepID=UPI0022F194FD|nr:FCD domain-containing protein [Pseudoroseomonas cervicalis]WBV45005.1 FCD domain-containing protein [Pseudoroseomonas cervicalis]
MPPEPSRLQRDLIHRLVEALRRDAVPPGTRLTEPGLARMLQVSRTPVRGVMEELARRGVLARREGGGYLLAALPPPEADGEPAEGADAVEQLCIRIAEDRVAQRLPAEVTEADLMRRYDVRRAFLLRVLGRLAEVAMVERKPGHGWQFMPSLEDRRSRAESYALRLVLEPAALLQPGYALAPGWVEQMRRAHQAMLERPWKDTDSIRLFEMNAAFHEGLVAGAGNRHMLLVVQQQNRLRRFLNYDWGYGFARVIASCTEHLEILDRIDQGEMEIASLLLRRHLERASVLPHHPGQEEGLRRAAEAGAAPLPA